LPQKTTSARINTRRGKFEVIVVEDAALSFRNGKSPWKNEIMPIDQIFKDYKKGLRASANELKEVFGTTNPYEIGKRIVAEGELLLSVETLRRLIDERRKQIASLVSKVSLDPSSGMPIPQLRIEQAMAQVPISIEPFKDAEEQLKRVLSAIRPILPLKVKESIMEVQFAPRDVQAGLKALEELGEIRKRVDGKDGEVTVSLAVPELLRSRIAERLSKKFGAAVKITYK
jgi:ribosome maturation protein SDO1